MVSFVLYCVNMIHQLSYQMIAPCALKLTHTHLSALMHSHKYTRQVIRGSADSLQIYIIHSNQWRVNVSRGLIQFWWLQRKKSSFLALEAPKIAGPEAIASFALWLTRHWFESLVTYRFVLWSFFFGFLWKIGNFLCYCFSFFSLTWLMVHQTILSLFVLILLSHLIIVHHQLLLMLLLLLCNSSWQTHLRFWA